MLFMSLWLFLVLILNKFHTFFYHSHKKQKNSLETWAVYIEIPLVSWNLTNSPKHQGSILKNMVSSEGDQLLAEDFHAIMGKIEAGLLQIAKK